VTSSNSRIVNRNKSIIAQHTVGLPMVAWSSGNAFHLINKVTLRRAGLVLAWVTARGR